jgi:hypothetical protein
VFHTLFGTVKNLLAPLAGNFHLLLISLAIVADTVNKRQILALHSYAELTALISNIDDQFAT